MIGKSLSRGLAMLAAANALATAQAQDLSVFAVRAPSSGCSLTASEDVTIGLFNYGPALPAGTMFNVSYTVNAGAPVMEAIVLGSTLLSNSTFNYTFVTPANLSVPGTYTFDATVNLPGDANPTNNAYTGWRATNSAPAVGGVLTGPGSPSSSGTLALSGQSGDIVQWEESDDGGLRWFALANTGTSQDYADLRAPAQFRVRVRRAACPADALSNAVTVSP